MQVNGTPARATFKTITHHFVCSVYLLTALYGAYLQLSPHVFIPTFIAFACKYEFGKVFESRQEGFFYFFLPHWLTLSGVSCLCARLFRGVYECVINPFVFSAHVKDRELVYFRFFFQWESGIDCAWVSPTLNPFVRVSVTAIVSPWVSECVCMCDKRED